MVRCVFQIAEHILLTNYHTFLIWKSIKAVPRGGVRIRRPSLALHHEHGARKTNRTPCYCPSIPVYLMTFGMYIGQTTTRSKQNPLREKPELPDNWRGLVRPLWSVWQHPPNSHRERTEIAGDSVRCFRRCNGCTCFALSRRGVT